MFDGGRFPPISQHATRAALLLAGACLLVACWPRASSAQVFTIGLRYDLATGTTPTWVAIGDFNSDGRPDLAVANFSDNTVSVLLGNGVGSFGAKADFATGIAPISIAIGDLNSDGKADLVVANSGDNTVSVLLNNGAGSFARTDFATGTEPTSLAIGDFNGDGKPDLVAANSGANTVSVLFGNGAGIFGGKADFATGSFPFSLAIGDLNGDGNPDVVTANDIANTVSVLLGNGDGTFKGKSDLPTGTGPASVAVADVNGDGHLDLVTANASAGTGSVLLGKGDGTFGPKADFTTATGAEYVAVGDLNSDGHPDLVVTYANGPSGVSVFQGNGDGTFMPKVDFTVDLNAPGPAIAGDVNGDGRPDLIAANYFTSTVEVLLNNNGGGFTAESDYAVLTNPSAIAIADVSGDGRPDIETTDYGSNDVSILQGNPAGGFFPHADLATGAAPMAVAVADLSGDGHRDIVTAGFATAPNESSVLINNGVGGFAGHVDYPTGLSADAVAVGDVNGNGKPDFVTANATDNTISVQLGNGNGTFGLNHDFPTGASPASVALADLNGDGNLDAVTANSAGSNVSVLLGDGNGNFPSHAEYATGANPQSVAIGDVNGDGIPDLVVADANPPGSPPGHVSILIGNGGGTFLAHVDLSTVGSRPYSVALADVNGDGQLDIITACMYSDAAYVMLGDGAGGFGPPYGYHAGPGNFIGTQFPLSVAAGYLNGDGQVDIALADYGSAAVSVLYGLTPTQMKLGLSQSLSTLGSSLTLTGTLTVPPSGPGNPLGTVRFFDGFTSLGSVRLIGGVATLHWTPPTLGSHTLSAVYSGDGRFFGSISPTSIATVLTTLGVDGAALPQAVYLSAPSPNPARGSTAFRFGLPHEAAASIRVYDVTGRLVRKLGDGRFAAGEHSLGWDLRDEAGAAVSAGMFFVRLAADGVARTGMLVVMP